MNNFFDISTLPAETEQFTELLNREAVRIERIVSRGHSTPADEWYDQNEHEWVLVVQGSAGIVFENGREVILKKGDHLDIPAHTRHRVSWTEAGSDTVWLAVFYQERGKEHE